MSTTYKKLQYNGYDAAVEVAIKDGSGNNIADSISTINTSLAGKQSSLSTEQMSAVNSGITSEKVTKLDNLNIAWEQITLTPPTVVSQVSSSGVVVVNDQPGVNSYEVFADGNSIGDINV